jgi:hypothetical protein
MKMYYSSFRKWAKSSQQVVKGHKGLLVALQDLCDLLEIIAKVKHNVITINNTSLTIFQYTNGGDGYGRGQHFPFYKFESLLYSR